jgi:endoglycosylceramidase
MKVVSIAAAIGAVALPALQMVQADLSKIMRVDPATQQFIDVQGRSRWFHGTNVVKKSFPWHHDIVNFQPSWSLVEKDIQTMKDLNINSGTRKYKKVEHCSLSYPLAYSQFFFHVYSHYG